MATGFSRAGQDQTTRQTGSDGDWNAFDQLFGTIPGTDLVRGIEIFLAHAHAVDKRSEEQGIYNLAQLHGIKHVRLVRNQTFLELEELAEAGTDYNAMAKKVQHLKSVLSDPRAAVFSAAHNHCANVGLACDAPKMDQALYAMLNAANTYASGAGFRDLMRGFAAYSPTNTPKP